MFGIGVLQHIAHGKQCPQEPEDADLGDVQPAGEFCKRDGATELDHALDDRKGDLRGLV